ncbi:MAG: triose-phosphate isomerase [Myxococcota bacterium]
MARRPFIAGNWKLNLGPQAAAEVARELAQGTVPDGVTVAVFPTALSIAGAVDILRGSRIDVGVQDVAAVASGAYTGANSAPMAKEAGCAYALVGHSERRQYFGETDEACATKLSLVFESGLLPIYAIGETLEEREADKVTEVLHHQLEVGLSKLQDDQLGALTIAYEPVWAIGTGKVATPDIAQATHATIRAWLRTRAGAVADDIRIQYGGSVKPGNAAELLAQPDIDGALVGGASLTAESFLAIVAAA